MWAFISSLFGGALGAAAVFALLVWSPETIDELLARDDGPPGVIRPGVGDLGNGGDAALSGLVRQMADNAVAQENAIADMRIELKELERLATRPVANGASGASRVELSLEAKAEIVKLRAEVEDLRRTLESRATDTPVGAPTYAGFAEFGDVALSGAEFDEFDVLLRVTALEKRVSAMNNTVIADLAGQLGRHGDLLNVEEEAAAEVESEPNRGPAWLNALQ